MCTLMLFPCNFNIYQKSKNICGKQNMKSNKYIHIKNNVYTIKICLFEK